MRRFYLPPSSSSYDLFSGRWLLATLLAALVVLGGPIGVATPVQAVETWYVADEPQDAESEQGTEDNELSDDPSESWLPRLMRFGDSKKFERNHWRMMAAFREVVSGPSQATVRILCNDQPVALGTIVGADGYVLTKASEVDGKVQCRLRDGRLLNAEVVGTNNSFDLMMLRVTASDLPTVLWYEDSQLPVGSWLATPTLDVDPVAIGVVSTKPRWVRGGILGVLLRPSDDGAQIEQVIPDTPAFKAGLRVFDVVKQVNGKDVGDVDEAIAEVGSYPPGEEIELTVVRGEEEMKVKATLASEQDALGNKRAEFQNNLGGPLSKRRAGFPMALEHDSELTPVDCGGPLVDLNGRVVGINIARAGRVSSYALPAWAVLPLLEDLKNGGQDTLVMTEAPPAAVSLDDQISEVMALVADWKSKFDKLEKAIEKIDASLADAQKVAAEDADNADARQTLQQVMLEKETAQREAEQAKASLNEAMNRLKELQAQKESS